MKQFKLLFPLILFVLLIYCFNNQLWYILYYKEQHSLFLYSGAYFDAVIASKGIFTYLTNFITQFFHTPLLGSIFLATIYMGIYHFTTAVVTKITRHTDPFQLPAFLLLFLVLQVTSVDVAFETPLTFLFCAFCYFLILTFFKGNIIKIIIPILFIVLSYFISFQTNLILALTVILSVFSVYGCNKIQLSSKLKPWISLTLVIILTTVSYLYIPQRINKTEKIMVEIQKQVNEKHWDSVLTKTTPYIKHQKPNQLIIYFHNLALANTNRLESELFNVPQSFGLQDLYIPWKSDSRRSEFGHYFYEAIGHINEATRWDFEAMVVWGETAPILTRLIRYNIVNKRPLVAQRFINVLKQSLYYKTDALYYQKHLEATHFDTLTPFKNDTQSHRHFSNVVQVANELHYVADQDPSNRIAVDYLLSSYLLSNQVEKFVQNISRLTVFNIKELPTSYQEVLFIYQLQKGKVDSIPFANTISPIIGQRFKRYYYLYKNEDLKTLKKEFQNTYWYYLHFISPYGNKIITK